MMIAPGTMAEVPPPTALHPCDPASTDYRDARLRLDRLDADIRVLAPDGNPESVVQELIALGSSRCFAIGGRLDLLEQRGPHKQDSGFLDLGECLSAGSEH
ncbi:MAG: hypothetical protein M3O50_12265 [Myxococcota bacterium]|nr:hypothetical protein [Myxococcota bacterium]